MKTVKFFTLGCKANQYDTQSIRERFIRAGFRVIDNGRPADFCVINTCTVTSAADRKSKAVIRQCIRRNPRAGVLVTGCLVKKDASALSRIKGVRCIISKAFFPDGITTFAGRTRAFLKIQDGCNNFCSYCKVPLVRGRSRSRPAHAICAEASALAASGFREIVLTGICLGSYGKDASGRTDLVALIRKLEEVPGILRLRLSSIEVNDVSEGLIRLLKSSKKLCKHLHIPLQSGDDEVLEAMNRAYTAGDFLQLIRMIRRRVPDIAITTDVLVGFPAETQACFQHTLATVKVSMPLKVHVFPFSQRPGTQAARRQYRLLEPSEMQRRIERVNQVADDCSVRYRSRFLGKTVQVLFEGRSCAKRGFWEGHTGNYLKVLAKANRNLANQLIPVKLAALSGGSIIGSI
ncbi:MAG TPA: MiaB/RimO family radical SAM methylthiotransferase [Patescibacteria group bacterium]|nr:MiaB/RimO family radical SAM methylthiotransferase [Patescibacteria group bacterium]